MWAVLHIDGRRLDEDREGLRRLLAEHTGCERSAAGLFQAAMAACRQGTVRYCVVLPAAPREGDEQDCASWELRVVREDPRATSEAVPGSADRSLRAVQLTPTAVFSNGAPRRFPWARPGQGPELVASPA